MIAPDHRHPLGPARDAAPASGSAARTLAAHRGARRSALVVLRAAGLVCDLAGGLGGLLLHGRFATAPPRVALRALAPPDRHFPHHARPLLLAWPPQLPGDLVPPALLFYPLALLVGGLVAMLGIALVLRATRARRRAGFASGAELRRSLSVAAVRRRAVQVRPSLGSGLRAASSPASAGLYLGREIASRAPLWASLEDSFVVLGPPRSGKGVSLIIPGVLDAPGAAIVTSTRPDVLRHTAAARRGPVEVFDPQGASGWPKCLRWSPVTGCENPLTAILRARGFATGAGYGETTSDGDYWAASAAAVIRCYLHAAALDHQTIADVVSWAGRPGDSEAVRILRSAPGAAPGWADDLTSQAAADPRTRDGDLGAACGAPLTASPIPASSTPARRPPRKTRRSIPPAPSSKSGARSTSSAPPTSSSRSPR